MRSKRNIAVFVSEYSCPYMGTILSYMREFSEQYHFNIIAINTRGRGTYDIPIALKQIDAAYIVVNSVHESFIKRLTHLNIPVVTNSLSYPTACCDAVISDQTSGIEKAITHLVKLGHARIGFAGNLENCDVFFRYEAYQNALRNHKILSEPNWLYAVHESTVLGGLEAAEAFLQRDRNVSAIICGCDLTAVGLIRYLRSHDIHVPQNLAVIGIDNTDLTESQDYLLTSIEQNLKEVTEKGIKKLLGKLKGQIDPEHVIAVEQSLVVRKSCGSMENYLPTMDTSTNPEIYATQMSALNYTTNLAIECHVGADDAIRSLSELVQRPIEVGTLANWKNEEQRFELEKVFPDNMQKHYMTHAVYSIENFPPKKMLLDDEGKTKYIQLIPTFSDKTLYKLICVVAPTEGCPYKSQDYLFGSHLELIANQVERTALIELSKKREQNAYRASEKFRLIANNSSDGIWDWDLTNNTIKWNNQYLSMLGYSDPTERNAQKSSGFFSNIHPQDRERIKYRYRLHITQNEPFSAEYRLCKKDNSYLWVEANGKVIRKQDGIPIRFVGALKDITKKHLSEEHMRMLAYSDSLTGLPNRTAVNETFKNFIDEEQVDACAVMVMDLDEFKKVNDQFGHDTGDALLKYVASSIKATLRQGDFFGRLGGDEFVMVCKVSGNTEACIVAHRLLAFTKNNFNYKDVRLSPSASLGIALYPHDGHTQGELLRKADLAMYRAKKNTNISYCLYHPPNGISNLAH